MIPTLQTIPVDCLLHIGTFLNAPSESRCDEIDEITLAGILNEHEMLQLYLQKHTPSQVSEKVALSGNLKALKWVIQKGCPMNENTCCTAAGNGYLGMIQWLRTQDCPWDERKCTAAAIWGHLETLQWLYSAGCPWDEGVCYNAAMNEELEMLQWAIDHGCPEPVNDAEYDYVKSVLDGM